MSIHNYEKRMEQAVESIKKDASIHPKNKQIFEHFKKDLDLGKVTRQISTGRIYKYVWMIKIFLKMSDKPFDEFNGDDIDSIVQSIDKNPKWKPTTKYDLKVCLKTFVRWLNKNYIQKRKQLDISWLKPDKTRLTKLPEELITPEEVENLISVCSTKRDKAFIGVLYESGARVGEILTMQVKHCVFDEYGAIIYLDGKTGTRTVRIIEYTELLRQYLEEHPYRNDPKKPFWLRYRKGSLHDDSFLYPGVTSLLRNLQRITHFKKRLHPHIFRHSRATFDAKLFTEHQLNVKYGWKLGSDMPSTYVSLSQRDMDEAYLKQHGIATNANNGVIKVSVKKCPKCNIENSFYDKFCKSCRMPLDISEIDKRRNAIDDLVVDIFTMLSEDNPKIKDKVRDYVKKKGLEGLFE